MKRLLLTAVAMGLALLLPAPALACVDIPAKTWNGAIKVATPQQSISNNSFSQNGCEWLNPALQGFDAYVFDVASHAGLPAKASWTTSAAVEPDSMFGYYRTATCGPTTDPWTNGTKGQTEDIFVPGNAKWLIVQAVTLTPGSDVSITVTSPGRKCPKL